jgi:hypothetical protein
MVPYSCFARPDSFSAVPRASGRVFVFCALGLIFDGTGASDPVFLFCAAGLVFGGTRGVGSRFLILRSRTSFRWYRGHRVPFSRFAPPYTFSEVPGASGPVFMLCAPKTVFVFCAPGLVFGGTEGVGSCFNVLRSRTRFRWYRGRLVPFSCFACPDSFSAIPRASGPIFLFCALGLVFGCSGGFGSRFIDLHPRTRFRRYRGRRDPFSCFVQLD